MCSFRSTCRDSEQSSTGLGLASATGWWRSPHIAEERGGPLVWSLLSEAKSETVHSRDSDISVFCSLWGGGAIPSCGTGGGVGACTVSLSAAANIAAISERGGWGGGTWGAGWRVEEGGVPTLLSGNRG